MLGKLGMFYSGTSSDSQADCPGVVQNDKVMQHCVSNWIFKAGNMLIDLDQLMDFYHRAWPAGDLLTISH